MFKILIYRLIKNTAQKVSFKVIYIHLLIHMNRLQVVLHMQWQTHALPETSVPHPISQSVSPDPGILPFLLQFLHELFLCHFSKIFLNFVIA
ncbi:hypothetical protein DRF67_01135 [Chryseobacterium pennipullorum]|uniref:Uncharacterized protein n=1 Tax=Chryseobacterium pennipullorum TaxID=2258963 RepID=A0A3D9BA16_9FLAO|nr:hypothetical protein DRF67_01135 [Chryseobacterium pennipullorum]